MIHVKESSNFTSILRAHVNKFKNKNCVENLKIKIVLKRTALSFILSLLREFFNSIGSYLGLFIIW
jgi:hypothetical protein